MSSTQNPSDTVQLINEESTIEDRIDELELDLTELFKKLKGEPYDPDKVKALFEAIEASAWKRKRGGNPSHL